jgi:hypothetical protein
VVALRWYTTEAFENINAPLRDGACAGPHPYAATVAFLRDGLLQLRSLAAPSGAGAQPSERPVRLWRGLRNVHAPSELMRNGCTELAPLSCTTDLKVAVRFASSHSSVLFLINSDIDLMQRPVSVR